MKFKFIRSAIGLPLFFIGVALPYATSGVYFFYFLGCFLALGGAYQLSKCVKHDAEGMGWMFLGLPIFFLSMQYNAYFFLADLGITGFTIAITRMMSSLIGGLMIMMSFGRE